MSLKQRFHDNLAAIQALFDYESGSISSEQAQPYAERYTGWGGFNSILSKKNDPQVIELKQLVGEDGYRNLISGVLDAFYTPPAISEFICGYLVSQGLHEGDNLLDPAYGLGAMSKPLQGLPTIEGVEIDSLTSRISSLANPSITISNKGFESTPGHEGSYSAVIANPPWGAHKVYDSLHPRWSKLSIHNYFMLKMMHLTARGGVFAAVVTSSFLDQVTPDCNDTEAFDARREIAKQCDLVAAFRLPNTAFSETNTKTISDIVIFRKRTHRENEEFDLDLTELNWLKTKSINNMHVLVNSYYSDNPNHILGTPCRKLGKWRAHMDVTANNFYADLEQAKTLLPNINFDPQIESVDDGLKGTTDLELGEEDNDRTVFTYFLNPKTGTYLQRIEHGRFAEFNSIKVGNAKEKRLLAAIELANTLTDLLKAEASAEEGMDGLRKTLNQQYEAFVESFGPINGLSNRFLLEDNRLQHIFGLEINFKKAITKQMAQKTGEKVRPCQWDKNDIFDKAVTSRTVMVDIAQTPEEALTLSIIKHARVSLPYMVTVSSFSEEQLIAALNGKLIFLDPEFNQYVTRDQYLSGNLKAKLRLAEASGDIYSLAENIAALKEACPEDVPSHAIKIPFLASWVPLSIVNDFVVHITGSTYGHVEQAFGNFICSNLISTTQSDDRFGTLHINASELLSRMINGKPIVIRMEAENKGYIDTAATLAAKSKAENIINEWTKWLYEDESRRDQLCALYNDTLNCFVSPEYDGSHLTVSEGVFPDQNPNFKYRPHQVNAVWHNLSNCGGLMNHVMGSGKTSSAIAAAYLGVKSGIYKNPILVVPKQTLIAWQTEFYRIFPNAKVLLVDDSNKSSNSAVRRRLLARVGLGQWDGIIMSTDTFKSIDAPLDGLQAARDELSFAAYETATLENTALSKVVARRIQSAKRLSQKHLDSSTLKRGYTFAELNTNKIFVDESQQFKSLSFSTQHADIKGLGDITGSARSFDLLAKIRHVNNKHRSGSRGASFLTGTALSNSIGEIYNLARYLYSDKLDELGLTSFDSFISVYSRPVSEYELTITGDFKPSTRFRQFSNLTELSAFFANFAHSVDKHYLVDYYEKLGDMWPEPSIKNGKPTDIIVDPDHNFRSYSEHLISRAENLGSEDSNYKNDNMLSIASANRLASMDLRLAKDLDIAGITLESNYNSPKTLALSEEVARIYKTVKQDEKGVQLVFISEGTPKTHSSSDQAIVDSFSFSTYHNLRSILINNHGIEANEIAFVHDAKTDAEKERIFAKTRAGEIRVLIGSGRIMGAGTNVQNRIVGLHIASHSWTASDTEQIIGRAIRQGNEFFNESLALFKKGAIKKADLFDIEILRYGMKESLDAFIIQAAETKSRLFSSFLSTRSLRSRSVVLTDEASIDFKEFKARVSGRPELLMKVQNDATLRKLYAIKEDCIYKNRNRQHLTNTQLPSDISGMKYNLNKMRIDANNYRPLDLSNANDESITIRVSSNGKKQTEYKTLSGAIAGALKIATKNELNRPFSSLLLVNHQNLDFSINFSLSGQAKSLVISSDSGSKKIELLSSGRSVNGDINYSLMEYASYYQRIRYLENEIDRTQAWLNDLINQKDVTFDFEDKLEEAKRLDNLLTIAIETNESFIDGIHVPSLPLVTLHEEIDLNDDAVFVVKSREATKFASLQPHTQEATHDLEKVAATPSNVIQISDVKPLTKTRNRPSPTAINAEQLAFNF